MDTEKKEAIFPDGFIFKKPDENTPEFIKGKISIKVEEFIPFLQKHVNNGWVNLDLKKSKEGKLYCQLNSFKPKPKEDTNIEIPYPEDASYPQDIPFL